MKKTSFSKFLVFGTLGSLFTMNQIIGFKAKAESMVETDDEPEKYSIYSWRFGTIYFKKYGTGKPLLLIHDLDSASSGNEWSRVIAKLAESHTVYAIDLLGCGHSQKPNITYTNFLYVQLITDFIKSMIGHRTDVIVTGASCSFVVTACGNNPDLFDKIIMINPDSVAKCSKSPNSFGKYIKLFCNIPIVGTAFYYYINSRKNITKKFLTKNFFEPYLIDPDYISHYYNAAHLSYSSGKALFSSILSHDTCLNIRNAVKTINNTLIVIGGEHEKQIDKTIQLYQALNPAIESELLPDCAHLPQLEKPDAFYQCVSSYLMSII